LFFLDTYILADTESRRARYFCGSKFVLASDIPTWGDITRGSYTPYKKNSLWKPNHKINKKVSLWKGDITLLEVDAIVNAANKTLTGGGGVDGAICRAAGLELLEESGTIKGGCLPGEAKIVGGYRLPAKYVVQTVGPQNKDAKILENAYKNSLKLAVENNIKSIAFPCIATKCYGFPNEDAANVALATTRKFLESDQHEIRIIFCVYTERDDKIYKNLLASYFPPDKDP